MHIINSTVHGVIDYLVVIALLLSPSFFGMDSLVANLTYSIAGIHLVLTVLTRFKLGLIKMIPLRVHGLVELVVGIVLLFVPWIFGFPNDPVGSNFYFGFGGAVLLVWILTDYRE